MYENPACATTDPELFFSTHPSDVAYAKTICRLCEHRTACYQDNLRVPFGTFGGHSEDERRRMRGYLGLTAENLSPLPSDRSMLAQRAQRARRAREAAEASAAA